MSYFFSVGDFGVAACERGYKAGDLENSGGIGHRNCVASNQHFGDKNDPHHSS
ncbi:Hypothetical protein SCF082_LOCUS22428 [Durusdinium trenchii]|uniref:Uncharacterized protein n=1 Tax=Durusdinium trenchii TaxID=1381693 RepID=A0ABP0LH22_9DINO